MQGSRATIVRRLMHARFRPRPIIGSCRCKAERPLEQTGPPPHVGGYGSWGQSVRRSLGGDADRTKPNPPARRWDVCAWAARGAFMLCAIVLPLSNTAIARDAFTQLKPDEQIIFYPALAHRVTPDSWRVEIQGRVFEPEPRRLMLALLREALDLRDVELSPAEQKIFDQRARLFLVDHERRKRVFIRLGAEEFSVGRSGADGRFGGRIILRDAASLRPHTDSGSGLPFKAVLAPDDPRIFGGDIFLLENEGVCVISDLDDTIKITEVRDRRATLRNTFLREFQPVPGMAEFYQTLARSNGASFHYVSASPWQLYPPLDEFIVAHSFPRGTFHLKEFRWRGRSFFSLFSDPEKYKPTVIEPLLKRFPHRRFILIGDSGERDPEIYATLARKYPRQIERIFIRDVSDEPAGVKRYQNTFAGLPRLLWQVFREPGEIKVAPE